MKHISVFSPDNIKDIPKSAGVYLFYDSNKNIIYVGKSVSLKNRLSSYLSTRVLGKTKTLVENIKYFSTLSAASEIEALIIEANLIKKYLPKYNIILKDDKSYIYVRITNDKYPRVIPGRKKDLSGKDISSYGPFPTARNVKLVLKRLRRVIAFSDHLPGKHLCFRSQIGLCYPCPSLIVNSKPSESKILSKIYKQHIKYIKDVFEGNLNEVKNDILKEIRIHSDKEEFEKAKTLRDYLKAFEYLERIPIDRDMFLEIPNYLDDIRKKELTAFKKFINQFFHIESLSKMEAYDISHISGKLTTASMIVFEKGMPKNTDYRHFRIQHNKGNNDTASMHEVGRRRSGHFKDWGIPDLVIIDGGIGQLNSFRKGLNNDSIPVIAYAKYSSKLLIITKNKYNENILKKINISKYIFKNTILNMIDEAHRFSRRYHHKLVAKSITEK